MTNWLSSKLLFSGILFVLLLLSATLSVPGQTSAAVSPACSDSDPLLSSNGFCTYDKVSPECLAATACTWREAREVNNRLSTTCGTASGCSAAEQKAYDFVQPILKNQSSVNAEQAKSAVSGLTKPLIDGLNSMLINALGSVSTFFGWLMQKSSNLFELSLTTLATITGFDGLYSVISDAVNITWTFIRDLANIVIIGLFVFIAISIILGLKEYGEKKLIARVLIVAVLINFSFLFTRIIINASNFFSSSIYTQMVAPSIQLTRSATAGTNDPENAGIAAGIGNKSIGLQLQQLLGLGTVNTVPDSFAKLATGNESGSLGIAFMQAFVSVLFSLLATLLFLYGALLILSRFIALMVCLLLSSLAFATFLLPSWSAVGWSKWWTTLLKNALLAPIMMVFLWASLSVSQGLHNNLMQSGNLGSLDSKIVMGYILILGLLGAGMYIANSLSNQVANRVTFAGAALPIALGSRFLVAPLGRQTLGRVGQLAQAGRSSNAKAMLQKASEARAQAASLKSGLRKRWLEGKASQLEKDATKAQRRADIAGRLAGSKFNPMDTGAMKSLAKAAGLGALSGASTKGTQSVADARKASAEAASKIAEKLQPKKGDIEKVQKIAEKQVTEQQRQARESIKATKDAADQTAKAVTDMRNEARKVSVQEKDAHEKTVLTEQSKLAEMIKGRATEPQLTAQKRLIEDAQRTARASSEKVAAFDNLRFNVNGKDVSFKEATAEAKKVATEFDKLEKATENMITASKKVAENSLYSSAANAAAQIGYREAWVGDKKAVAKALRSKFAKDGEFQHHKHLAEMAHALTEAGGHGGGHGGGDHKAGGDGHAAPGH